MKKIFAVIFPGYSLSLLYMILLSSSISWLERVLGGEINFGLMGSANIIFDRFTQFSPLVLLLILVVISYEKKQKLFLYNKITIVFAIIIVLIALLRIFLIVAGIIV